MVTKFTRAVKKCGNGNGVRELYYGIAGQWGGGLVKIDMGWGSGKNILL